MPFQDRPLLTRTPLPLGPNLGHVPPSSEPETPDLLKLVGLGVGLWAGWQFLEALLESPATRRRRALNRLHLGLPKGRMSFPVEYRDEISRAHDWRCTYCNARTTRSTRQIDHAISLANGGSNEPRNLVNACGNCNQAKGALNAAQFRRLLRW